MYQSLQGEFRKESLKAENLHHLGCRFSDPITRMNNQA